MTEHCEGCDRDVTKLVDGFGIPMGRPVFPRRALRYCDECWARIAPERAARLSEGTTNG